MPARFLRRSALAIAVCLLAARPAWAQLHPLGGDFTGAAVVPPTASTAHAYARADQFVGSLTYDFTIQWTGLAATCSAVHVHGPAAPGVNGPIVFTETCAALTTGGLFSSRTLTAGQQADLESGLYYIDIHDATYPNGEIRAQLLPTPALAGRFTTAAVVPGPSTSAGNGMASVTIGADDIAHFTVLVSGLTYTGMHLHGPALPGANGPIVQTFGAGGSGTNVYVGGGMTLTPTIRADLLAGKYYFDIHSATFPDGALRAQVHVPNLALDYNGDGREELAVRRTSTNVWYAQDPGSTAYSATPWGTAGDIMSPGDYDGDGAGDQAIFRAGTFYIRPSFTGGLTAVPFGASGDGPSIAGDYDGDGRADIAVYRGMSASNHFYWLQSTNGAFRAATWGTGNDVPVLGDFDGDHKTDPTVYRITTNTFYVLGTASGFTAFPFGVFTTDYLTAADYDGDGKTDFAVFRFSGAGAGVWYIWQSSTGTLRAEAFGTAGDIAVPGDYDGDGKADLAVVRQTGANWTWFVRRSSDGGFFGGVFGLSAGDGPIAFTRIH